MQEIRSYVIRIYRRKTDALAGLVEHVQTGRSASFQSLAELGELLSGRRRFRRNARRGDTVARCPPGGASQTSDASGGDGAPGLEPAHVQPRPAAGALRPAKESEHE